MFFTGRPPLQAAWGRQPFWRPQAVTSSLLIWIRDVTKEKMAREGSIALSNPVGAIVRVASVTAGSEESGIWEKEEWARTCLPIS